MSSSNEVILITGTSSGFGRDTAETLAAAGHRVFASMRDIEGRNKTKADALRAKKIEVVELDVTSDASVASAVGEVVARAGKIDILINNAGLFAPGVSEAYTSEQVQALFDVNVVGIHRVLRAVLPTLRKQRDGLVVNVGSILGRVTIPFMGLYGASKFAVEAMTESYRYELSQLGIEVVLVQPSAYPTDLYTSSLQPRDTARITEYGKTGELVGELFAFLGGVFKAENAPNPHDIAVAIQGLVDGKKGMRPNRVVVGAPYGSDVVNQTAEQVQHELVKGLGLSVLDTFRKG